MIAGASSRQPESVRALDILRRMAEEPHFDLDIRGMMLLANRGTLERNGLRLVLVGDGNAPVEKNPLAFEDRCASDWKPCRDIEITMEELRNLVRAKRMERDGVTITMDGSVARLTGKNSPPATDRLPD